MYFSFIIVKKPFFFIANVEQSMCERHDVIHSGVMKKCIIKVNKGYCWCSHLVSALKGS